MSNDDVIALGYDPDGDHAVAVEIDPVVIPRSSSGGYVPPSPRDGFDYVHREIHITETRITGSSNVTPPWMGKGPAARPSAGAGTPPPAAAPAQAAPAAAAPQTPPPAASRPAAAGQAPNNNPPPSPAPAAAQAAAAPAPAPAVPPRPAAGAGARPRPAGAANAGGNNPAGNAGNPPPAAPQTLKARVQTLWTNKTARVGTFIAAGTIVAAGIFYGGSHNEQTADNQTGQNTSQTASADGSNKAGKPDQAAAPVTSHHASADSMAGSVTYHFESTGTTGINMVSNPEKFPWPEHSEFARIYHDWAGKPVLAMTMDIDHFQALDDEQLKELFAAATVNTIAVGQYVYVPQTINPHEVATVIVPLELLKGSTVNSVIANFHKATTKMAQNRTPGILYPIHNHVKQTDAEGQPAVVLTDDIIDTSGEYHNRAWVCGQGMVHGEQDPNKDHPLPPDCTNT